MSPLLHWRNIREKLITALVVVSIVGGILLLSSKGTWLPYWPWLLPASAVYFFWSMIEEGIGRRQHRTVIQGRRLAWLTGLGFSIENIGAYWGYKGTYRSFFVRIFYNWESNLNKRSHELCIMVYFEPPVLANGELDVVLLDQSNAAVTPAFWEIQWCRMDLEASYLAHHTPITFLTSRRRIRKRIDRAVDVVMERKLRPIEESAVHELVKGYPAMHGPSIDTFQAVYGVVE